MPLSENGKPDYCLECIGNMTIQCAWCENLIAIGSPITLYTPAEGYEVPGHAVPYTENSSKAFVGCLGWNCADTGGDRAGFWLPDDDGKGKVHRVPTAIETLMSNPDATMLIIQDTHNVAEAENPKVITK